MSRLLKSDFYRLLKSKLSIITLIIAVVLPLFATLMIYVIGLLLESIDPESAGLVGGQVLIASCFSFTNNFGIVLPIFAAIFIMLDISSGTVRNKTILGYRRYQIYASHYIVTLTYCLVGIALYAGMTVLWSTVILGMPELTDTQLLSYVYFFILGFISFALVAAIATFFSLSTLNSAGSVILTLATCLVFGLLSSILMFFDFSGNEVAIHILRFIPCYFTNAFSGNEIDGIMFIEALSGNLIFTALFYILGNVIFSRRDLK